VEFLCQIENELSSFRGCNCISENGPKRQATSSPRDRADEHLLLKHRSEFPTADGKPFRIRKTDFSFREDVPVLLILQFQQSLPTH